MNHRYFLLSCLLAGSLLLDYGSALALQAVVPETGQSVTYDPGDDGDLKPGLPWPASRFTSNGNGTVSDNLTGLIWLLNADCTDTVGGIVKASGSLTWANALTWSNGLASGNCSLTDGSSAADWRLPDRTELQSLLDASKYTPALPDGHPFNAVQAHYWSSTTYAGSTTSAWVVNLDNGTVYSYLKASGHYVWPVRGGLFGNPVISVLPAAGTYGDVAVSSSSSQTVTVSNSAAGGASKLQLSAIDLRGTDPGQFNINPGDGTGGSCGSKTPLLPPGASCTVAVSFSPTSAGAKSATLRVSGSDANAPNIDIALSGTGVMYYTATASVSGGNGTIATTNPLTVASGAGATFTLTPAATYQPAGSVSGDCPPGSWNGNDYTTGAVTANCTVGFTFTTITYPLTITFAGSGDEKVTVLPKPPGVDCRGSCSQSFDIDTAVTLTATAAAGYSFSGWSSPCSGSGSCQLTMDAAKAVTATFIQTCGSSHTSIVTTAPAANLCNSGTPTSVTGTGPWSWICQGASNGPDADCVAYKQGGAVVQIPQTGQSACFDAAGAPTGCAGTGQDGELRMGLVAPVPRITDNGDQTVTDNLSGLIWSKNGNIASGTKNWHEALDYIKNLNGSNYQGHNDWRLPDINELQSLISRGAGNQADWLNSGGFTAASANFYWSSSTVAGLAIYAWGVAMNNGYVGMNTKTLNFYVWPVRGGQSGLSGDPVIAKTGQTTCYNASNLAVSCSGTGQDGELQLGAAWPTPRFSDNGDQSVTDNLTGLIWSKSGNIAGVIHPTKTWQGALNYINGLNNSNYQGHSDWRLPNISEIGSLLNKAENSPGTWLNNNLFTDVQAYFYWSSSINAGGTTSAWGVSMDYGLTYADGRTNVGYVWPVRGGQSGNPVIAVSPLSKDFGNIASGGTVSQTISISNTAANGSRALQISAMVLTGAASGQYSINPGNGAGGTCGTLTPGLEPGTSCTLTVSFSPTSSGAKSTTLRVSASDVNAPNTDITLSGTGYTLVPGGSVKANGVTFGTVSDGLINVLEGGDLALMTGDFYEVLTLDRAVTYTLIGGYDAGFTTASGLSTVHGSITITAGTVSFDGIVIQN